MNKPKPRKAGESILATRARKNRVRMERYRRYRAQGLCGCGRKPRPGEKSCAKCANRTRNRSTMMRRRTLPAKRLFGVCHEVQCHAYAVPGRAYCGYHMEKRNDTARDRTHRRIAEGKCSRCDAAPEPGRKACRKHLDLMNEAQRRCKVRHGAKKRTVAA